MVRGKKTSAPAAHAPPAKKKKPEYEKGKEWPVERLTGKRCQSGKLASGMARWEYEVEWKSCEGKTHPNTFEPAEHLVGFEVEMKKVDTEMTARAAEIFHRPLKAANDAKEAASKKKADELETRRKHLLRKQLRDRRARARSNDAAPGSDEEHHAEEEEDVGEAEFAEFTPEQLAQELLKMERLLREHGRCVTIEDQAVGAEASDVATQKVKKQGPSRVWLAYDFKTNRCKLPCAKDKTRPCGAGSGKGSGTSGHLAHLKSVHGAEWAHIMTTGEVKTTVQMIDQALAAQVDESKPLLGQKEMNELHRLTALWIAKCGRPLVIVEDPELNTLVARILELCKARLRYKLPCRQTVKTHLKLLGHEGKALGRDFIVRLINSGVKPTISGDLWSDGGMGLFGIYAHGITETWVMEKALIGLIACEKERHTAVNIKKWTTEALTDIGLVKDKLLADGQ